MSTPNEQEPQEQHGALADLGITIKADGYVTKAADVQKQADQADRHKE